MTESKKLCGVTDIRYNRNLSLWRDITQNSDEYRCPYHLYSNVENFMKGSQFFNDTDIRILDLHYRQALNFKKVGEFIGMSSSGARGRAVRMLSMLNANRDELLKGRPKHYTYNQEVSQHKKQNHKINLTDLSELLQIQKKIDSLIEKRDELVKKYEQLGFDIDTSEVEND